MLKRVEDILKFVFDIPLKNYFFIILYRFFLLFSLFSLLFIGFIVFFDIIYKSYYNISDTFSFIYSTFSNFSFKFQLNKLFPNGCS